MNETGTENKQIVAESLEDATMQVLNEFDALRTIEKLTGHAPGAAGIHGIRTMIGVLLNDYKKKLQDGYQAYLMVLNNSGRDNAIYPNTKASRENIPELKELYKQFEELIPAFLQEIERTELNKVSEKLSGILQQAFYGTENGSRNVFKNLIHGRKTPDDSIDRIG